MLWYIFLIKLGVGFIAWLCAMCVVGVISGVLCVLFLPVGLIVMFCGMWWVTGKIWTWVKEEV